MLGFFGALDLGARSLRTQRQGLEVAGQNLANVNNPAYARQRLQVQTSFALSSAWGSQGTGAEAAGIQQIRDALLDKQVQSESSVGGYLGAQQRALESLQHRLGENLGSQALSAAGLDTDGAGISSSLGKFFSALQGLSASPSSTTSRQHLIAASQQLTSRFNAADVRIETLSKDLSATVQTDVEHADKLLASIASLNRDIASAEGLSGNVANDLRDKRQQKIEELSSLLNVETSTDADGVLSVAVAGSLLVSGKDVADRLQAYDAGGGRMLLRLQSSGADIVPTSGSIQGTIDARDGAVAALRRDLNTLATELASTVNGIHRDGYNLDGGSGADFFTGATAGDLKVNSALAGDLRLIQASGSGGETGNNQVALALARLQDQPRGALGERTFGETYASSVSDLNFSLSSLNERVEEQRILEQYLQTRRASVSGVSIDEEMTDMVKYEKAFQASARLVATLSEMLEEVINLKR